MSTGFSFFESKPSVHSKQLCNNLVTYRYSVNYLINTCVYLSVQVRVLLDTSRVELELYGHVSLKVDCVMESTTVEILVMKQSTLVVSSCIHK